MNHARGPLSPFGKVSVVGLILQPAQHKHSAKEGELPARLPFLTYPFQAGFWQVV